MSAPQLPDMSFVRPWVISAQSALQTQVAPPLRASGGSVRALSASSSNLCLLWARPCLPPRACLA